MNQKKTLQLSTALLLTAAVLGLAAPSVSASSSTPNPAQRRGGGGGGGGGRPSGGGQRSSGGGDVHARREGVRTQNFVSRTSGGYQRQAPVQQQIPTRSNNPRVATSGAQRRVATGQVRDQRTFTKTANGRHYDNGMTLRKGVPPAGWERRYFPHGSVHFPFYRQSYVAGQCFISPFGFYFGVCLPFIDVSVCSVFPPPVVFIDLPVYRGNNCTGFAQLNDPNLISDPNLDQNEPGLNNALDELTETFQGGNIDGLVSVVSPNVSIAVFERGTYQYTVTSNNFVDLTRDALQSTTTIGFQFTELHQRSPGVFCVSGTHTYQGQNGRTRTVYVSFVLQDISGLWTLTQVGTSPDIIQSL